jgi:hypothetical protein
LRKKNPANVSNCSARAGAARRVAAPRASWERDWRGSNGKTSDYYISALQPMVADVTCRNTFDEKTGRVAR